ncbi:MAG: ABC transporter ATP-binding protein [Clostridiales bacterium]|nr:ABC transporter ATP-binding protein [Clostridiales bacterium]
MIKAQGLSKSFGEIQALNHISLTIRKEAVFGLIGTNGAGKSTFLRLLAGVLKADSGDILIEEKSVYENPIVKESFFFIPDDPYYFPNSRPLDMRDYYALVYQYFDKKQFDHLLKAFDLLGSRKINTFSKGMKKQLAIISALAAHTPYIFCDETFDGLDPVMRQAVKSLFAEAMAERGLTPLIASHNLRELEDICDHVGLLHQGGILLTRDLEGLKLGVQKVQAVFDPPLRYQEDFMDLEVQSIKHSGALHTMIVQGERRQVEARLAAYAPLYLEILPLTLEEVFLYETEVVGYDIKSLLL